MAMLAAYSALLANGQISEDPAQNAAVQALDKLATALLNARRKSFFRKADKVRGLYIWGDVGRGKSMLMDLFFQTTQTTPKRRVHFHAFMQEVHGFLAYWRGLSPPERRRSQWRVKGAGDDPIQPAAAKIAASARLICFDEFQVTQIADAMILSRLFEALFDRGVTVVSTSNRPPEDLYKHGINRQLFLPFIKLLEQECETLELVSARDYRLERLTEAPVWHTPIGPEANSHLDAAWTRLTLDAPAPSETLDVSGRALHVPRAAGGCCRFSFEDLCVNPLGPADYLAIATQYHTVFIDGIPTLGPDKRNEAARFVTLIDALYEGRVNLVASAAAEPEALYPQGDGSFEFQRTVSRLHEMRSAEYIGAERVSSASQEISAT